MSKKKPKLRENVFSHTILRNIQKNCSTVSTAEDRAIKVIIAQTINIQFRFHYKEKIVKISTIDQQHHQRDCIFVNDFFRLKKKSKKIFTFSQSRIF